MYLKRLEIQGFKSFADKISLEFSSGITSVVGPNGSGKSNIADAIRWVLGEQSAKTLRGSKMEDVIFAGTEQRRPLGFSEVSITIDNSDGVLPVDYSEVTVTRRVFRSGESEYFINKTPCRLKDINELFFDTGLGKDGYSVIGQGKIDDILSSKSEDRRRVFEEASGIMKYKVRRQEAEKKLELTKQNLLRVKDIAGELEKQLEPLKKNSDNAKKYLNLREKLKELEVNVFVDSITRLRERIRELDSQLDTIKNNIDDTNDNLDKLSRSSKEKSNFIKKSEENLENTRHEFYNLENSLERCLSEIKLNKEKILNLLHNIERIDNEINEIYLKSDEIANEINLKKDRLYKLQKDHAEYLKQHDELKEQVRMQQSLLGESEKYIESHKARMIDKMNALSEKKLQINSLDSYINNIVKNREAIDNEIKQLIIDKKEQESKRAELEKIIDKLKIDLNTYESNMKVLLSTREQLDIKLSEFRKQQNKIKSEIQAKSSRYKLLIEMEKNFEGYHKSVRAVLGYCKQSHDFGQGIHGALVQLLKAEKKYEVAIEMALGGALQNIVTSSEEDAKKAIQKLKETRMGRATFLPITSVKGNYMAESIVSRLKKYNGFCGIASDLISYSQEYKGIILNLLGRVVVVDNIDTGISISRDFRNSFKIVTLEGDIISTSGSMTGGSIENRGVSILSRNREIGELKEYIARLNNNDKIIENSITILLDEINKNKDELSLVENKIKDSNLTLVRDESNLSQIVDNIDKTSSRIELLTQEKNELIQQEAKSTEELKKYNDDLSIIEQQIDEINKVIEEHQDKYKEDQSVRDELFNNLTNCKISINSISENINSIEETINRLSEEKELLLSNQKNKLAEKNKNAEEIENIKQTIEGLKLQTKKYQEEKTGRNLKIEKLIEEKKVLEEELQEISEKIDDANKNLVLLQEELGRVELKKSKTEMEIESIQSRMWDEYELTYNNALSIKKDIGSLSQAQKSINEYRAQIKQLGPVNISSIEEYIKTKERYEFMMVQSNDMELSINKLNRVIYEMTGIMKKQFTEQFEIINDNFNKVFKELFGGGRARLFLPDQENVLESGIEIEAQPPGKRLQNLMLLSGGERAFTAIALLFAILRLRPVPFCVLDEIEAALDEANVYRFLDYIRLLSEKTQFIMITHRKGTMEGSDRLYGVTMEEHGISKVVSLKFDENKKKTKAV